MKTAGGLLVAGGTAAGKAIAQQGATLVMPSDDCRPTVRLTPGPYYTLNSLQRPDIREDRAGIVLRLSFTVMDDYLCTPLEGVTVDIWHSDANGLYSDVVNEFFDHNTLQLSGQQVDTRSRSFLRGHQVSDSEGRIEFTTIYPGWYSGRLSHIHIRAMPPGAQEWGAFFTQLFLPPEMDRYVYSQDPYQGRGFNPMTLERDLVLRGDGEARQKLTLPVERMATGLRAEMVLAI